MKILDKLPHWLRLFVSQAFSLNFIFGVFISFVIFYGTRLLSSTLIACYAGMLYSISYVLIQFYRKRKLDFYGSISVIFMLITFVTVILANNTIMYLYKNLVDDFILFSVFALSLLRKKPLMQIIVEKANTFDPAIIQHKLYNKIWRIETMLWMIYYFLWFLVQLLMIQILGVDEVIFYQKVIGKITFYALLIFSYYYPTPVINKIYAELASTSTRQVDELPIQPNASEFADDL